MCENQFNMEQGDDFKMVHSQHSRILKEEDEMWISSEDLNTENSSDDEKSKRHNANRKKSKVKNRKRSSTNINTFISACSLSTDSSPLKSSDERVKLPLESAADDSKFSDEENSYPPPATTATTRTRKISSDCLLSSRPKNRFNAKRLSLEDWRPTKGALNISSLEEAASASGDQALIRNKESDISTLFNELGSLKLLDQYDELDETMANSTATTLNSENYDEEIRKNIDTINKMDEEINEIIDTYKKERQERIQTEIELCKDLKKMTLNIEKNTEKFWKLCNFEEKLNDIKKIAEIGIIEAANVEQNDINMIEKPDKIANTSNQIDFVHKNILAAKEGTMAGLYITDEQKLKIAELLKDIETVEVNDLTALRLSSSETLHTNNNDSETNSNILKNKEFPMQTLLQTNEEENAFCLVCGDRKRIEEIDAELKNFNTEDNKTAEEINLTEKKADYSENIGTLEQAMQNINKKLTELYESYMDDDEKLKLCSERKKADD